MGPVVGVQRVGADMYLKHLCLISVFFSFSSSSPMWYMCDLCEVGWFSCVIKCPVEQFLNRKKFDRNNVYIGETEGTDEKTKAEEMLENFMMVQTGHDVI